MIGKIRKGLECMADFYRTAPYGETNGLLCAYVSLAVLSSDNFEAALVMAGGALISVFVTAEQFELRKRLEESVREHGYDDRLFKPTLGTWCDKQTAMVAAKNSGCLEDYVALRKRS